ncbi:MAG: DUF3581 domain-containing protein [Gammaproteobacteria bacterium]|nr:DUF3581 domain-containing protein [Gammaproteobacteria bacterium]
MSFLEDYYQDAGAVRVSRQQASDFAKRIAGDFNPLHDADAKPFCVPGDLLFALVLNRYGLSQQMTFSFKGMVGDGAGLVFPDEVTDRFSITDEAGKEYMEIERSGNTTQDASLIQALIRRYVEFSGQTFPDILVPLMAEHGVMINPARPMVIYASMGIRMNRLDISDPQLNLSDSMLNLEGKRAGVTLNFNISAEGEVVGRGEKSLVLSGLRPYDQEAIEQLVQSYGLRKQGYQG